MNPLSKRERLIAGIERDREKWRVKFDALDEIQDRLVRRSRKGLMRSRELAKGSSAPRPLTPGAARAGGTTWFMPV